MVLESVLVSFFYKWLTSFPFSTLKKKFNKQIWKMEEKLEGEKGFQRLFVLLPILKTQRQKLAEILLRKIQKRRKMTTQERRRG